MRQPKDVYKRQTPVYTVLLVCVIILSSWVGYVGSYLYPLIWGDLSDDSSAMTVEEQRVPFEKGQFTVLMMGCDARPGDETSRSDTLMVAFVDLTSDVVRLVDVYKRQGYKGRVAIHEVMTVDNNMRRMIADKRPINEIKKYIYEVQKMKTLRDSVAAMVLNGETTVAEMLKITCFTD